MSESLTGGVKFDAERFTTIRNLADIAAIEATPIEKRLRGRTLLEFFRGLHDAHGDEPALIWLPNGRADDEPQRFTYAEIHSRILSLANLMRAHGVSPTAPVTLLMPNLPEMHLSLWAGAIAGAVTPINSFLNSDQIVEIMEAAGSRTVVAPSVDSDPELAAKAAEVAARIAGFGTSFVVGPYVDSPNQVSLDTASRHANHRLEFDRTINPDETALMLHTGGTTGTPKLVRQTHRNLTVNAAVAALLMDYRPDDRVLTGLPLFHTNAAIVTGLAVFNAGGTVLLAGRSGFRAKETIGDFWRIVERHRVTAFCGVPTVLASLLDVSIGDYDVSSLRSALCGAAPLSASLFAAFEQQTGVRILEGYGLTESTALSTLNPRDGERRIGSIGLRIPYQEVSPVLLDQAGGYVRDCQVGETGALLIRGPAVTPGYVSPAHNAKAWPRPGWINTGDLGRVDRDGYIWLAGRTKDIIIRGGHNIDPAIIEDALSSHPSVDLVAGIGYPDLYAGEIPMAFVTLKAHATADELREYARKAVTERAAAPAFVEVIPSMPVTAVGKIFKSTLREWAAERAVRAAVAASGGNSAVRSVVARHDASLGLVVRVDVEAGWKNAVETSSASRLPLKLEVEEHSDS